MQYEILFFFGSTSWTFGAIIFFSFFSFIYLKKRVSFQVHGMLSQMDPALVTFCDKIAAQGGPICVPDDIEACGFPPTPVVQQGTVTRTSARLRNVQPEVNLSQSYEALRRPKKIIDTEKEGITSSVGFCFLFFISSFSTINDLLNS